MRFTSSHPYTKDTDYDKAFQALRRGFNTLEEAKRKVAKACHINAERAGYNIAVIRDPKQQSNRTSEFPQGRTTDEVCPDKTFKVVLTKAFARKVGAVKTARKPARKSVVPEPPVRTAEPAAA